MVLCSTQTLTVVLLVVRQRGVGVLESWSLGETQPVPQGPGTQGSTRPNRGNSRIPTVNLTLTTLPATHFRPPAAKRRPSDPTADAIHPRDLDCMKSGHFPRRHAHYIEPSPRLALNQQAGHSSLNPQSPSLPPSDPASPEPNRQRATQPRQQHKNQTSPTSSNTKKPNLPSPSPSPQPPPQPPP